MTDVFIPIEPEVMDKPAEELLVGGLTRMTTIDFPDCLSAVVFIKGCPWKCVYCQNEDLQSREMNERDGYVSWEYIDHFLDRRKGLIDGVVFSGGEPCVDPALPDAVKRVKEKGYKIGLHTGGMYPRRLRGILPFLDWVGLDIKAPLSDEAAYEKVVRRKGAAAKVRSSLEMLLEAGVSLETRTTVHPEYHTEEQILQLARELSDAGVETYALQIYRQPRGLPEEHLLERVGSDYPHEETLKTLESLFKKFIYRRS